MSSKDQLVYPAVVSSIEGRARTIFTGDLSYFCTEDDLLKLFTPIGNILSVNVARKNDSSLMYGFVEFESLDVAEQAAKDLNRQMFMGRNLRIYPLGKYTGPFSSFPDDSPPTFCIHVSFVTHNINKVINEDCIRELFASYGDVYDVAIRRYYRQRHRQYGYAFVDFLSRASALSASENWKDKDCDGISIKCTLGHRVDGNGRTSTSKGSDKTVGDSEKSSPSDNNINYKHGHNNSKHHQNNHTSSKKNGIHNIPYSDHGPAHHNNHSHSNNNNTNNTNGHTHNNNNNNNNNNNYTAYATTMHMPMMPTVPAGSPGYFYRNDAPLMQPSSFAPQYHTNNTMIMVPSYPLPPSAAAAVYPYPPIASATAVYDSTSPTPVPSPPQTQPMMTMNLPAPAHHNMVSNQYYYYPQQPVLLYAPVPNNMVPSMPANNTLYIANNPPNGPTNNYPNSNSVYHSSNTGNQPYVNVPTMSGAPPTPTNPMPPIAHYEQNRHDNSTNNTNGNSSNANHQYYHQNHTDTPPQSPEQQQQQQNMVYYNPASTMMPSATLASATAAVSNNDSSYTSNSITNSNHNTNNSSNYHQRRSTDNGNNHDSNGSNYYRNNSRQHNQDQSSPTPNNYHNTYISPRGAPSYAQNAHTDQSSRYYTGNNTSSNTSNNNTSH